MNSTIIRPATVADRADILAILNHYIVHTPVSFDAEPYTEESRLAWFERFAETGRYRLIVAEEGGAVVGYACSTPFRAKASYQTTVETTVYLHPDGVGRGLGTRLYEALFKELKNEDVRLAVAGMTMPNPGSEALHDKLGFEPVGVYREVGRKFDRYWDVAWVQKMLD